MPPVWSLPSPAQDVATADHPDASTRAHALGTILLGAERGGHGWPAEGLRVSQHLTALAHTIARAVVDLPPSSDAWARIGLLVTARWLGPGVYGPVCRLAWEERKRLREAAAGPRSHGA
jgi:hypothetical protein